ncbi:MAG: hypothetical protein U0796_01825 [Gemmatales bacterium]
MMRHWKLVISSFILVALLLVGVTAHESSSTTTQANVLDNSALRLAPATVSYFASSLRLKERLTGLWNTRAMQNVWKTALVQKAWSEFNTMFEQQAGPLQGFLEQKENKELVQLLINMSSEECFVMGGSNLPAFNTLLGSVIGSLYANNMMFGMNMGGDAVYGQLHGILDALQDDLDKLAAPDVVMGFKVPDAAVAKRQLARLSVLLNTAALAVPQLTGQVKSQKIKDSSFTTVTLDGAKMPWDKIPWDEIEDEPGEFDDLKAHLKEMKITFYLGYHEGYILMGVGPTMGFARNLGQGQKLADLKEFDPLRKHLDKKFTSLGYSSKEMNSGSGFTKADAEKMVTDVTTMLENSSLDDKARDRIQRDLEELTADVLKLMGHDAGPAVSFGYATPRGEETFHYQYSVDRRMDFSKPLDVLQHVGGDPILAMAGRGVTDPANWLVIEKWAKKCDFYIREYGLPQLAAIKGSEWVETLEKAMDELTPILVRFSTTMRENLLPAQADGQYGFVVDSKLLSTQWYQDMPASKTPLPLLEPAFLIGVSDAAKLKKAGSELRAEFNDAVKVVKKLISDENLNIQWPAPETREIDGMQLYWYAFAEDYKLDGRLRPSAGVSRNLCALTVSNEHALRLLQPTPLAIDGGPLADARRPLGGATVFNMAGLVRTAEPWVNYAIELHGSDLKPHMADIKTMLQSLQYFQGYSSATYVEGNATVTHGEWRVKDVQP